MLVVQRLRIYLTTQGTQVWSLVGELGSTRCRATKPTHCSYWAHTLGTVRHNQDVHVLQQRILRDAMKIPCAATKTSHSKIMPFFFSVLLKKILVVARHKRELGRRGKMTHCIKNNSNYHQLLIRNKRGQERMKSLKY